MDDKIKENAIYFKNEFFFELLKTNELVFFGERKFDPDSFYFMQIVPKKKVDILFANHSKKRIEVFEPSPEEYYELDDGRYAILFNDGDAEVFMNFRDMEILEDIIG